MKRFSLAALASLGLVACVGGQTPEAPLTGAWKVVTLGGMILPAEAEVTLAFAAPNVSGMSGCNRFTGSYTQSGQTLRFGPVASTRMACAPQLMDIETGFSTALTSITGFDLGADGVLKLRVGDAVVMQAQRG